MKKILLISSIFLLSCSTKVTKEKVLGIYTDKMIFRYADECQNKKLDFLEQKKCDCIKSGIINKPDITETSQELVDDYIKNLTSNCI